MKNSDRKNEEIVHTFQRTKSLYHLRSELRGRLGIPRTRTTDGTRKQGNYSSVTPKHSMTLPGGRGAFALKIATTYHDGKSMSPSPPRDYSTADLSSINDSLAKSFQTFDNLTNLAKTTVYESHQNASFDVRRGSLPPPTLGHGSRNLTQLSPGLFRRETSFAGKLNGQV